MKSKDWRPTAFVETAPGVVSEAEADAARLEQRRSLLAFIHRLMALDAAALVLTITLIEKAFAQPQRRELVAVAVGGLLFSAIAGGFATLALLARTPRAGARLPSADPRGWLAAAALTLLGFGAGIAALAGFFLVNWFR